MLRSVHPDLIRSVSAGALRHGYSLAQLSEATGSPVFSDQPDIPRFPRHLVDSYTRHIRDLLKDEALGFLSQPLRPGTHEYCCRSSINGRNIREVLIHISRYFSLITDSIRFELEEQGENACYIIHYPNPDNLDAMVFINLVILTIHRWINWLSGKRVLFDRVNLAFAKPVFANEYEQMFGAENHFGQPGNSIIMHRRYLDLPVIQTTAGFESLLPEFPKDLVARLRLDNSLSAQVQRMLQSGHEFSSLTFQDIASELLMTTDTLRRRLKDEGNSFGEIKESVRYNAAVFWLTNTQMPINSIALRMGFSEPSAFNRAFRKWAGMTPGEFRQTRRITPDGEAAY